jgi:hypothetical protein
VQEKQEREANTEKYSNSPSISHFSNTVRDAKNKQKERGGKKRNSEVCVRSRVKKIYMAGVATAHQYHWVQGGPALQTSRQTRGMMGAKGGHGGKDNGKQHILAAPAVTGDCVINKNLLSNNIWIMAGLDLEVTVVCPEVDRVRNTGNSALIHLRLNTLVVSPYPPKPTSRLVIINTAGEGRN